MSYFEIIVKNQFYGKCGGHGIANIRTYISLGKKILISAVL